MLVKMKSDFLLDKENTFLDDNNRQRRADSLERKKNGKNKAEGILKMCSGLRKAFRVGGDLW